MPRLSGSVTLSLTTDGEDAVNIIVSPQTVVFKKNDQMQNVKVYVDLYKGETRIPYNSADYGNMVCSQMPGENGLITDGLAGILNTDEDNRCFYGFIYFGGNDINMEIPFTVTYNGKIYNESIFIKTIADGEQGIPGPRGAILRGPQNWADVPVGFPFENGEGTTYLDIVVHNGEFFVCKTSRQKQSTDLNPVSDYQNGGVNWEPFMQLNFVATRILLTQYALIKNLGVECIDMKDADGNILFQAKDGNVTCRTGKFVGITVQNAEIESGHIAGFKVSGTGLTNDPFTNDAYIIFRNDANKCFAGIGGNILPASSGARAVARFENNDTADQWGLGRNIAMLLSAENGNFNHAFLGTGNGTLDGWIGGHKFSKFLLTKSNTIYDGFVTLRDNNRWIICAPGTIKGSGIVLPTLNEVQQALSIAADKSFCVEFTIVADLNSNDFYVYGRNALKDGSNATPWNTDQIPVLTHWTNGRDDRIVMGAANSETFLLVYDQSQTGTFDGYSLKYTARRINHQA